MRSTHVCFALLAALAIACNRDPANSDASAAVESPVRPGDAFSTGEMLTASSDDPAQRAEQERQEAQAREKRWQERRAKYPAGDADALLKKAKEAIERGMHKDAWDAVVAVAVHAPAGPRALEALEAAVRSSFALNEFGDGLTLGEDALFYVEPGAMQARLHRMLGDAYLTVPHHGTVRGGKYLRNQWGQGIQTQSYREDRAKAIYHLQAARALMASLDGKTVNRKERIETNMELAAAVARYTPYDPGWSYWWYAWGRELPDGLEEDEGSDEHAGSWRGRGRGGYPGDALYSARPRGIPLDVAGRPVFVARPGEWSENLDDTAKLKYLLHEVRSLDDTKDKVRAAGALVWQALLFRTRDGSERLERLANGWWDGGNPYKKDVEGASLEELADDEVLGLLGTHVGVYKVPDDENVLKLLAEVSANYPRTPHADEASVLMGRYHESRRHYLAASETYRKYLSDFPQGARGDEVKGALQQLELPEMAFVESGVHPTGRHPAVKIRSRNLDRIEIVATLMDMQRIVDDYKKAWPDGARRGKGDDGALVDPDNVYWAFSPGNDKRPFERYRTKRELRFTVQLKRDPGMQYSDTVVPAPIDGAGLWVLRAQPKGSREAYGLALVEPMAVINKETRDGAVMWVVDSSTGKPVAGADVEMFEHWEEWTKDGSIKHSKLRTARSDNDGIVRKPTTQHQVFVTVRHGGQTSWLGRQNYWRRYHGPSSADDGIFALVTTDRPVYRPGDRVEGKVWARRRQQGRYAPATDVQQITVRIRDAKGTQLLDQTLDAKPHGSGAFSVELKKAAALGMYQVQILVDGSAAHSGGASFRVEEYKAPEFTVSVAAAGQAKLGDKIPVEVSARYLFGGGVADGRARYRVYREDYEHHYSAPGPWDWLYGAGYGRCYYAYGWLPWWHVEGPSPWVWYPWWGPRPEPARELVLEGEGVLGGEGKLRLNVDTTAAKRDFGDSDHKYTVVAEVTDLSRRLIKGEGSIVVTRSAYLASIETEHGYYSAGESITLLVSTQLPDGKPVAANGRIVVEEVIYGAANGATATTHKEAELPLSTDVSGPARKTWRAPRTGLFKFTFVAPDAWGGEVRASSVAWIMGSAFEGKRYKFNGLELITDRRTYQPGDTAHLLINVDRAGSSVLLATRAEGGAMLEWRVIPMPHKTRVVDIPVTDKDVPNFFVEATTVGDGNVFQEAREVFVPPKKSVLNVQLKAPSAEVQPGSKAELEVTTTDERGNPVSADVAVSVFDSAVLYIQEELTPDARSFFWARKRGHTVEGSHNLGRVISYDAANLSMPDRQAAWALNSASSSRFRQAGAYRDGLRGKNEANYGGGDDGRMAELSARGPAGGGAPASPMEAMALGKSSGGAKDNAKRPAEATSPTTTTSRVTVRKQFADTALFAPMVRTDAKGKARVTVTFPDNLTTWRIKAIGLDDATRAGQTASSIMTTKKLLVRMQAPRFFRERDEVTLSAIVHNKHGGAQAVTVTLDVPANLLEAKSVPEAVLQVPANGEQRVDFRVKVKGEGLATVRMTARAAIESDAKELTFPVLVHGMMKTVAAVGSISAQHQGTDERSITVDVPEARRPEQTRLVIRYSPSLAGAMLDALPYLLEYPYGCTEQTLSRFVPAVLTRKALKDSGNVRLLDLGALHANLNAQQATAGGDAERERLERLYRRFKGHPVFDDEVLDDMIATGLERVRRMQHSDGGWGWWTNDQSSLYTTAYALMALKDAGEAGLSIDGNMLARGQSAMKSLVAERIATFEDHDWIGDSEAFFAWVLARHSDKDEKLNALLWEWRGSLSLYGKLLAALTFHAHGDAAKSSELLRNVEQFLKADDENETAWLATNNNGWWYWWNDDIETNALYLRALDAMRPKDPRAAHVVKWLLNHRKHGYYWDSTRDTAMVVAAFANHMKHSGEGAPDYDLDVMLDGEVLKTVHIGKENFLTYDAEVALEGVDVPSGKHEVKLRRRGSGAVYFNTYLSYFTLEEDVQPAGLEIKVARRYFRLERQDRQDTMQGDRGQSVASTEVAYRKVPLLTGATVKSGDLILVELMLSSKNDYTQLVFEDPKPAGAEPVALRSGATYGEAVSNMELRDEKVVFFLNELQQGELKLSYRLRAEIPGQFHAMPTHGFGMYAPELQASSAEMRLSIVDNEPR